LKLKIDAEKKKMRERKKKTISGKLTFGGMLRLV